LRPLTRQAEITVGVLKTNLEVEYDRAWIGFRWVAAAILQRALELIG